VRGALTAVLALGVGVWAAGLAPAAALEATDAETAALKSCEQKICAMALSKKPSGDDLKCALSKTWDKDTLKKGESKSVKWGFGDARCTVDLDVKREDVILALTKKEHTVEIPPHTVHCTVERDGEPKPVTAKLAPKLIFKDGKADKIWINLSDIDGPANVKATVWMAANLEDTVGIFHKPMIKSVNKFLYQKCAQRYFADGRPKPDPKELKKAQAEAAKAAKKKEAAQADKKKDDARKTEAAKKDPAKPADDVKATAKPAAPDAAKAATAAPKAEPPAASDRPAAASAKAVAAPAPVTAGSQ
jgi:hypothetical protein